VIRHGSKVTGNNVVKLSSARRMSIWDLIHNTTDSQTARVLAQELPLQDQLRASVAREKAKTMTETTAMTRNEPATLALVVPESKYQLLKDTVAPNLTDSQFDLFVQVCNRRRLDPFLKQIHAVVRQQWNPVTRRKEPKLVIQTGIDGFRVTAERTREFEGEGDYQWCGPDGVWRDIWLDKQPPAAARATVYRKGRRPSLMTARWDAYVQTDHEGNIVPMWRTRGPEQLAKCAAALAYRAAFPEDLSGLYTDDEMGQADKPEVVATVVQQRPVSQPSQPAANGGKPAQSPKDYKDRHDPQPPAAQQSMPVPPSKHEGPLFSKLFPFEHWRDKPLRDAPIETLADYIAWCEGVIGDRSRTRFHKQAAASKAQAEAVYREAAAREMDQPPPDLEEKTAPMPLEIGPDVINASLDAEYARTRGRNPNLDMPDDDNIPY
jgi:phage recombination protein Bet